MKKLLLVCMLLVMPVMAQADEAVWIERGIDDTYSYAQRYNADIINVLDKETGQIIRCIVFVTKYERGNFDGAGITCPDFLNVDPTTGGTLNGTPSINITRGN